MRPGFAIASLISFGALFLGMCVYAERDHVPLLLGPSTVTMGTVSSFIFEPPSINRDTGRKQGNGTWRPVIDFVDGDGKPHHVVSRSSSAPKAYEVGDPVRIVYDPASPDTGMEFWPSRLLVAFAGFGLTLIGFGLGLWWWLSRRPDA